MPDPTAPSTPAAAAPSTPAPAVPSPAPIAPSPGAAAAPVVDAPAASAKPEWKPPVTRTKATQVHTPRVQIPARAVEADPGPKAPTEPAAASAGSEPTPSASAAPATSSSSTSATEPPKADEPKPDGRVGKAWADILDKEAKLTAEKKDLKPLAEAKELVAKGQRLKALEVLGISLADIQSEYLASIKDESPEDVARRVAEETLTKREADAKAAADKADQDAKDATQKQLQDQTQAFFAATAAASASIVKEIPTLVAMGATPLMLANWVVQTKGGYLKDHDPTTVLREYEAAMRATLAPVFTPVAPAASATATPARGKDTAPNTLTTEGAGEVPLVAKPKRRETAHERAARILAEMNLT